MPAVITVIEGFEQNNPLLPSAPKYVLLENSHYLLRLTGFSPVKYHCQCE